MSFSSKIYFFAIPSPRPAPTAQQVRLTVFVSPRLYSDQETAVVGDFDFGTAPWPTRLQWLSAQMAVVWNNGAPVAAQLAPAPRPIDELDASLWNKLFPTNRVVDPFEFYDFGDRVPVTFDLPGMDDVIKIIYSAGTEKPGPLPITATIKDGKVQNASLADQLIHHIARASEWVRGVAPAPSDPSSLVQRFHDALDFYHREERDTPEPPVKPENFEFHEIVSLLGDHPTLLRRLGLVFDIFVPAPPVGTGTVQFKFTAGWRNNPNTGEDRPTKIHYVKEANRFYTASAQNTHINKGYLRLEKSALFRVLQLDTDGSLLKLAAFADAMRNRLLDKFGPAPTSTTLPALRSGGLTIAEIDRASRIVALQNSQATANEAVLPDLWAEDLVRGYRVDVKPVGGSWRSLHLRVGDLSVQGGGSVTILPGHDDEGYVKAASSMRDENDPESLYIHEAVAGWSGWSLAARAPGKSIVHKKRELDGKHIEDHEYIANEPNQLGLQAEYEAKPGSLPRLRFGITYQLRARVADIAGGGLPHTDTDESAACAQVTYKRFEPVPSPVVVHRTPITEAESLEHMVIRSIGTVTPGTVPATTTTQAYVDARKAVDPGTLYQAENHRHMLPPKASLELVERHGKLDASMGTPAGAQSAFLLCRRESGTTIDQKMWPFEAGNRVEVMDLELRNKPGVTPATSTQWPKRGDGLKEGQYVRQRGEFATLTYLPDPAADSTIFIDDVMPTQATGTALPIRVPWSKSSGDHDWARLLPIRIELRESTNGKVYREWSTSNPRVLIYKLPPGHMVRLNYASGIPNTIRDQQMGVWDLLNATQRGVVGQELANGTCWRMAPPRTITLVHAVQKPVAAAWFGANSFQRDPASTSLKLIGEINVHGKSTGAVDIVARWNEIFDVPTEPSFRVEPRETHVSRLNVEYGVDKLVLGQDRLKVKTRDLFTADVYELLIENRENVPDPVLHELGDTKCRVVKYDPVSTSRYQEYFPADVIQDPDNLRLPGTAMEFIVPSSAPPVKPDIVEIVPSIKFSTSGSTRKRHGGSFRIYMPRGWFSSGHGERLAILLHPDGTDPALNVRRLYSQWGRDPAWTGVSPPPLGIGNFFLAIDTVEPPLVPVAAERLKFYQDVVIPEAPGKKADILAYMPVLSKERNMWYVDVDLVGAVDHYLPFLSLALARFQPNCVEGALLSEIVRADFTQILPDRSTSFELTPTHAVVQVMGMFAGGNSYSATQANLVRAIVQSKSTTESDVQWKDVGTPQTLQVMNTSGNYKMMQAAVPRPAAQTGKQFRLRVYETETYATDGGTGDRITYFDLFDL